MRITVSDCSLSSAGADFLKLESRHIAVWFMYLCLKKNTHCVTYVRQAYILQTVNVTLQFVYGLNIMFCLLVPLSKSHFCYPLVSSLRNHVWWLWTSHQVEDYGDAMFIRPISEVLSSNLHLCLKCPLMLKVPTLNFFVHVHFMGIREELVQPGKLWVRSRVTTTNHHSEPGLFFNHVLSGFLSVSKWSWHLHDRLSLALKGSTLQTTACRGQICSVPTSSSSIYQGQTF